MTIKISTETIIRNVILNTIKEWQEKVPAKRLDEYTNWQEDIVKNVCFQLTKRGISIDEVIITEEDKKENSLESKEGI